jgi:transcriptional regulator with XRE-family HTH domain
MTRSVFLHAYKKMLQCLIDARKASEVTQVELAERLGSHQSYVSKFESGDRRIDVVEFLQICRALNADPLAIVATIAASLDEH